MKKILPFVLIAALLFSGCKKYLDINSNPANPQISEPRVLLPPILAAMGKDPFYDGVYMGQYVQYWGTPNGFGNWERQGYDINSDNAAAMWRCTYFDFGLNLTVLINNAAANKAYDYLGAGEALRAWAWQTTTDQSGEMILKEAFDPNRLKFDYDSQAAIYAEVVRLCKDALLQLARNDGSVTSTSLQRGDLLFNGDRAKWIKFVYAILARNAQHQSNKNTYDPASVISLVNLSLSSNSDNVAVPFSSLNSNTFSATGKTNGNIDYVRQSAAMVTLLDGTLFKTPDPRKSKMLVASLDSTYRGVVVASGLGDPNRTDKSKSIPTAYGKYIFNDYSGFPIITYSELQFIKAEAAFIKKDLQTAFIAYKQGISSHMDFCKVSPADRDKYLNSVAVVQDPSKLGLQDIMTQKYIALYGFGALETWVDVRRYHYDPKIYPQIVLPTGTTWFPDNSQKPAYRVRPRYNSEYLYNIDALKILGADKPDYHTVEQWFSKSS